MSIRVEQRIPAVVFFSVTFVTYFVSTIYATGQLEAPIVFEILAPVAFIWTAWWWLRSDSIRTGYTWPLDLGMFLYIGGWIFILPYYLVKTRGLEGVLYVLAFVGVLLAAWLMGTAIAILMWS